MGICVKTDSRRRMETERKRRNARTDGIKRIAKMALMRWGYQTVPRLVSLRGSEWNVHTGARHAVKQVLRFLCMLGEVSSGRLAVNGVSGQRPNEFPSLSLSLSPDLSPTVRMKVRSPFRQKTSNLLSSPVLTPPLLSSPVNSVSSVINEVKLKVKQHQKNTWPLCLICYGSFFTSLVWLRKKSCHEKLCCEVVWLHTEHWLN